jgi:hypothetical protein
MLVLARTFSAGWTAPGFGKIWIAAAAGEATDSTDALTTPKVRNDQRISHYSLINHYEPSNASRGIRFNNSIMFLGQKIANDGDAVKASP